MRSLKPGVLAALALLAGMAGWLVNLWAIGNGLPTPSLHVSSLLTVALITAFTLAAGWRVRRWRNGDRSRLLDPIFAARTLVLGQSAAFLGALMGGWHAGILMDQLALVPVRSATGQLWTVLALTAGGAVMAAAGMVVERFCRLPPPGNPDSQEPPNGADGETDGEGEYAQQPP